MNTKFFIVGMLVCGALCAGDGGTPRGNSPVGHAGSGREHAGSVGDVHDAAILTVAEELIRSVSIGCEMSQVIFAVEKEENIFSEKEVQQLQAALRVARYKNPFCVDIAFSILRTRFGKKDVDTKTEKSTSVIHTKASECSMGVYCPLAGRIVFGDNLVDAVEKDNGSWWCCPRRS